MKRPTEDSAVRRIRRMNRSREDAVWEERRKACMQALLNRPWIVRDQDPELYHWIREQYQELREWFMEYAGFPLIVTRWLAKLEKTPVVAHPWMGFPEFREPLDYALFTYGLWFLEGKTEMDQFLLTDIVEQVREQMAGQGMTVDWTNYVHRLSMARALKKLKALGVLLALDGDEAEWAQDESRNVLYECSPLARYVLRRFPQDLTQYRSMEELADPILYADTPEGAALRRRHRVYRRFLLEPVVLDRSWNEEDLYYVITQRRSLIEQLGRMLGWEGRRYREGLLFFHPELTSEAELFPTLSAVSDLVLLVAGELRRLMQEESSGIRPESDGSVRISRSTMEHLLIRLKERYKDYWSKEQREAASSELAQRCFAHMEEWGLGEWDGAEHFVIWPVLGRWTAEYAADETYG